MWRRRKPAVSFALASLCLVIVAGWFVGAYEVVLTPNRIRQEVLLPVALFVVIAMLLLYEW